METLLIADMGKRLPAETERALARFPLARRKELARLKNADDRARSVVGEAAVRLFFMRATGEKEETLCFARERGGKPFLASRPDLFYNLSHSGAIVVCAFSDAPVGVDVERCKAREIGPVVERCFLPEEREETANAPDPLRVFYRLWTAKESALKRIGEGVGNLRGFRAGDETVSFSLVRGEKKLFGWEEGEGDVYLLSVSSARKFAPAAAIFCSAEEVLNGYLSSP